MLKTVDVRSLEPGTLSSGWRFVSTLELLIA